MIDSRQQIRKTSSKSLVEKKKEFNLVPLNDLKGWSTSEVEN